MKKLAWIVWACLVFVLILSLIPKHTNGTIWYKQTPNGWQEVPMESLQKGDIVSGDKNHECKFIVIRAPYKNDGEIAIDLMVER